MQTKGYVASRDTVEFKRDIGSNGWFAVRPRVVQKHGHASIVTTFAFYVDPIEREITRYVHFTGLPADRVTRNVTLELQCRDLVGLARCPPATGRDPEDLCDAGRVVVDATEQVRADFA